MNYNKISKKQLNLKTISKIDFIIIGAQIIPYYHNIAETARPIAKKSDSTPSWLTISPFA